MIDEWCERQIDRLCAFWPAYFGPRMTRFYHTKFGWRMYLYAKGFSRSVIEPFTRFQWIEKEEPQEEIAPPAEEEDPDLARLDPDMRRQLKAWDEAEKEKKEKARRQREKLRSPQEKLRIWWAGRHERARRRDEKWAARDAAADARADRLMQRAGPVLEAVRMSRFPFFLLMAAAAALGVLACGADMGYLAAALLLMWLAAAFEGGYAPLCAGVRQRYLAAMMLRAGSYLALLPMYFGGYLSRGVSSNVVLQSAMIVLLFAHAAFFFALVAFNKRQMLLPRLLSGVLGVVPALTAAAAIALAAASLGLPQPAPICMIVGAVGALMAFAADRLTTLTELGGIRLRFAPLWIGVLLETGFLLMLLGAWLCAA